MSQLYKVVNGFDAMSGAAFGGGGKSSSRSKSKSSGSVKKWKNPISSHPSAMTSNQYNEAYNTPMKWDTNGSGSAWDEVALGLGTGACVASSGVSAGLATSLCVATVGAGYMAAGPK